MPSTTQLCEKALAGERLSADEALLIYENADFHELGHYAHEIRRKKHGDDVVTYVVDRNINYSNVCVCACKFCAYYSSPESENGFVLTYEEIGRKIDETLALGGTQILLQGGHHPHLPLEWYEDMLRYIKKNHPIHVHAFSPPEIVHFSSITGCSTREVIHRLMDAGLDSIPGGGAEILVDRVRTEIAPNKASTDLWLGVMQQAHEEGLRTSATMMFGHAETAAERIEHLIRLREVQDRTGGFTAFIPWTFQPSNTAMSQYRTFTGPEYLRMLATSRLVLDNFDNLQASWVTMGPKVGQLALRFGANDFGSTMIEENVVAAAGVSFLMTMEEMDRVITAAGYTPRQRRQDYSLV